MSQAVTMHSAPDRKAPSIIFLNTRGGDIGPGNGQKRSAATGMVCPSDRLRSKGRKNFFHDAEKALFPAHLWGSGQHAPIVGSKSEPFQAISTVFEGTRIRQVRKQLEKCYNTGIRFKRFSPHRLVLVPGFGVFPDDCLGLPQSEIAARACRLKLSVWRGNSQVP